MTARLGPGMSELIQRQQPDAEITEPQARCRYCGAPLIPGFYFCLACGTPYKPMESVLPPHRPIQPTEGMLIERKAPHVWPLFWTYLGVILFGSIAAFLMMPDSQVGQIFFMEALLLIATAIWGGLHWRALAVQFKRFGLHRWEAVVGVAALAPLLGINYLYHDWIREMFEGERLSEQVAEAQIPTAVAIITFCVLPAILEEIAFRGLLQHWLHIAVKPITALLLASALFAALHFSLVSFWYLFLVGMLLGWLRYRTGSLYPAMVVHFLHNLIVLEVF